MDYFAGLDVSVKETSVCVVDDAGNIVREARVASEPEALLEVQVSGLRGVARALTARGVRTARGGDWTAVQVSDILRR